MFQSPAMVGALSEFRRPMSRRLVGATLPPLLFVLGVPSLPITAQPTSAETPRVLEVQVFGPDGKPVPGIVVGVRSDPPIRAAQQVKRGAFTGVKSREALVQADADGMLALEFSRGPKYLCYTIEQPGYGPYWAEWRTSEHPEEIPPKLVVELDEAWTVGGIVTDGSGSPVEGATIDPSIKFKKRPGDTDELWVGTDVLTDAEGKWQYQSVPASMRDLHVAISHDDFKPERRNLARSEFGVESGKEPAIRIPLNRGIMVVGKVTDEAGQPIVGALVRAKFVNDIRKTTTGDDGTYFLAGCEPRMARIVVGAKGRAMELQNVRIEPDMQPVDFILKPGGHVRLRALDENDKPIPRTRVFFQRWRGNYEYFEFDGVNQYADANGVWEWNEAPLDEFKADICRPGGMQLVEQPLVARDEEYIFRPPPALVVTGKIADASTKEPVKKFRIVPGKRWSDGEIFWSDREGYDGADGEYRIQRNRGHIAHFVRVEADGYQRAVSREIKSDEGKITIDFELQPAKNVETTVLAPDGTPAVGAKVALGVARSQIHISNGAIDDGSTYAKRLEADATGKISYPAPDSSCALVITHPAGFAHLKSGEATIPEAIQLTPWARLEGVFKVDDKATSGVTLSVNSDSMQSYDNDGPNVFTSHETATGVNGEFVFDRVIPGKARVGRRILLMVNDGATEVTSSKLVPIELRAGETTRIELGGDGRAVVGRLAPPANFKEKVLWNFAMIHMAARSAKFKPLSVPADVQNDAEKYNAWFQKWIQTDEGLEWTRARMEDDRIRMSSPFYSASIARDGTFRIDDVPAGHYLLSVQFQEHPAGQLLNYALTVPEEMDARKPIDLGVLTLEEGKSQ